MQDDQSVTKNSPKRRWPLAKVVGALFVVAVIFSLGVSVGRGNLQLGGLSATPDNKKLSNVLDYSSINEVYRALRQNYDGSLNEQKLLDGLKAGLVSATGDPYTEYFNPTDAKEFNNALAGSITGIGAELGMDTGGNIIIVAPLSGYPAEKAGLKPKDIITAVNGESMTGLSVSAAVKKIRGDVGSTVKLTIVRGEAAPFEVQITRQQITIPSVETKVDGAVGYLKISQFTADTAGLVEKSAQQFKDQNVKALVVDLRNNPGGYLSSAVGVASLWLERGQAVVSERRGGKITDTDYASGNNILKGLPTAVIINSGSASASEILAGALRDHGAATLVGEKSFGKGSIQKVETLSGGAQLKVTIARWYTPKGVNIDKQGIVPEVLVTNTEEDVKAGRDPQKDRAYQLAQSTP